MTRVKGILHIFNKEFKTFFVSPIAYIVIFLYLLITGFLFFSPFFVNNQATLRSFFGYLPITFCFVLPAITMSLFSEELNVGSYELLLTLPVSFLDIIIGKFISALAFACIAILPTLSYPLFIGAISSLDWGPVIGGYIGAVFLAAAYSAIGLLASALTKKQIIAFIIGFSICLVLFMIDKVIVVFPVKIVDFFQFFGADYHFRNIAKGVIDFRDILYFISICFIAMYATRLIMEEKK